MTANAAPTAAEDFDGQLADLDRELSLAQRLRAKIERRKAEAADADRRGRLAEIRDQLATHADGDGRDRIASAAAAVTDAVNTLRAEIASWNTPITEAREQLRAERTAAWLHACVPPPPATSSIAPVPGHGIAIGERTVTTADPTTLTSAAVAAATDPAAAARIDRDLDRLVTERPDTNGRWWRDSTSGAVFAADHQLNAGCVEILPIEALAALWGLAVRDMPAEYLDRLTAAERARIAPQLVDGGGDPDAA